MLRHFFSLSLIILIFISFPLISKAESLDADNDGLSDALELKFKTDANNPDTDNDGYNDGLEVQNGYNPTKGEGAKLEKRIEINLKEQRLAYFLGSVEMGKFPVSSGKKSTPTPKGTYEVGNKSQKAWSRAYGLWMPYWLGFKGQKFGIHELPIWQSGYREGASHLGTPVSHGCVRLGIGPAKTVYDFAAVGTKVKIY